MAAAWHIARDYLKSLDRTGFYAKASLAALIPFRGDPGTDHFLVAFRLDDYPVLDCGNLNFSRLFVSPQGPN